MTSTTRLLSGSLGLLALAVTFGMAHLPRLSGLSVALFVGMMLFTVGGGIVVLAAWAGLAAAPGWFAVASRTPPASLPPVRGGEHGTPSG